ncbi:hypothetical protein L1887_54655 [Cichorium endivia]|nr:hypothetical protein L1887_54655 [Cichorium endivia]
MASDAATDFDPNAPTAMDKMEPPKPGADFNVVIIGAGNINFGSDEGPWNHSFRLEHKLGPRLKVVALIDPSAARADAALTVKRNSFVLSAYKDTVVYPTFADYVANVTPDKRPHAIWVGSPPAFRGREQPGRDLEKKLVEAFPDGFNYSTEIDVLADGYSLRLVDPYNAPALYFRRPGDDHEEVVRYQNDDPFFSEVSNLIDNIEKGKGAAPILSSYDDAVKTYALTWAIREASEKSAKKPVN